MDSLNLDCYIESKAALFLQTLKAKGPFYKLLYCPISFDLGYEIGLENEFYGMSISTNDIRSEDVGLAHANGLWNVRTGSRNKAAILKTPIVFTQINGIIYLLY